MHWWKGGLCQQQRPGRLDWVQSLHWSCRAQAETDVKPQGEAFALKEAVDPEWHQISYEHGYVAMEI